MTQFADCLAIVVHVMHGVHVTVASFFVLLASSFFVSFAVDSTFVPGDLGHEYSGSA